MTNKNNLQTLTQKQLVQLIENGTIKEIDVEPTDSEGRTCDAIYQHKDQKFYVYLSAYMNQSYAEQAAEQIYETLHLC